MATERVSSNGELKEYSSEILIPHEQITQKIKEAANQIDRRYDGKNVLMVCILMGAIPTHAELQNSVNLPDLEVDALRISSYNGQNSGEARLIADLKTNINGRHVLLVEDILDTGATTEFLHKILLKRDPASLSLYALLDKQDVPRRETGFIEGKNLMTGFKIPNVWVEGFGLDTDGMNRGGGDITYRKFRNGSHS